jgi:hypothetical protein
VPFVFVDTLALRERIFKNSSDSLWAEPERGVGKKIVTFFFIELFERGFFQTVEEMFCYGSTSNSLNFVD